MPRGVADNENLRESLTVQPLHAHAFWMLSVVRRTSPQAEGDVTVSGFHDLSISTQPRGRLVPLAGWAVRCSNTHAHVAGSDTVILLFKIF